MAISPKPPGWQVGLVLVIGVLTVSTAAILVRLSLRAAEATGLGFSLVLAASRLTIAALVLLPVWRNLARSKPTLAGVAYAGAAGASLAFHFAVWITSLSYTSIVASTTLVTTNPIWIALFSWVWLRERLSRLSLVGVAVALSGSLLIALADTETGRMGSHPLLGDCLALMGAWAVSFYFLLGREAQKRGLGIGPYIAIAYSVAAILLLPLPLLVGTSYTGYSSEVYLYILLMALLPQLIGHTSFNWAIRFLSPTLVTLAILFEPVSASLLGYVIFGEVPPVWVLVGAVVILMGVAIATIGTQPPPSSPQLHD